MRRTLLAITAITLALYIVWDRIEAYRLSNAIAAIAARGEPVRYDEGLPAPKTAEQREAASLYAQAAGLAYERDLEENHRASRLDVDAPGGTEIPLDEIRADYRGDDPAMPLLDRATPMDFGGFDAEQRGEPAFQQSRLEWALTSLGSFACLRADLASISGDADTAVAALVPCLRLQRTLYDAQYRSTHSVRILGSLRIFLRHIQASDGALVRLARAIDTWPEEDAMLRSTLVDRSRFIEMAIGRPFPGVGTSIAGIVFHPLWLASARRALPAYDEPIANANLPWAERWTAVERHQREMLRQFERQRSSGWFTRLTDPFAAPYVWSNMWIRQFAYDPAARRIATLAISIERYRRAHDGALPASVDTPEDPFSGRPLVYKQEADSYVVYSVDLNRKDDGGILYGFGAAGLRHYGQQTPRDFGIRVPLKR
jgi:hypothetical protein